MADGVLRDQDKRGARLLMLFSANAGWRGGPGRSAAALSDPRHRIERIDTLGTLQRALQAALGAVPAVETVTMQKAPSPSAGNSRSGAGRGWMLALMLLLAVSVGTGAWWLTRKDGPVVADLPRPAETNLPKQSPPK